MCLRCRPPALVRWGRMDSRAKQPLIAICKLRVQKHLHQRQPPSDYCSGWMHVSCNFKSLNPKTTLATRMNSWLKRSSLATQGTIICRCSRGKIQKCNGTGSCNMSSGSLNIYRRDGSSQPFVFPDRDLTRTPCVPSETTLISILLYQVSFADISRSRSLTC